MTTHQSTTTIITIDGPSGAGKGTMAMLMANHYQYNLLDSGALYRLVALQKLQQQAQDKPLSEPAVAQLAANLAVVFSYTQHSQSILLQGQEVAQAIRQEVVGNEASIVAAMPLVRSALLQRQREFATGLGLVADGRDMGTTVFPAAQHKFFLTATSQARADRRLKQLQQKGISGNLCDILTDLEVRDARDSQRDHSPLEPASDAVLIDASDMTITQVFDLMVSYVDGKHGV